MKIFYTGLESSGKSLMLSREAEKALQRNIQWLKRTTKEGRRYPRTMAFNMPMSEEFKTRVTNYGINYIEWRDFDEIEHLREADIFIDEVLKIFPARGTEPLPPHQIDFLTQGAKSGIFIYGSSQDFSQVHKQLRLLANKVYVCRKLVGSARPMLSRPLVKDIWGVCIRRGVKPESFKGDNATMESKFMPMPFLIKKRDTSRYDTLYKIPRSTLPDLKLRKQRQYAVDEFGKIIYEKVVFK